MIKGLYETHLDVENLERSIKFYGEVLGLKQCHFEEKRRAVFFWIGEDKQAMLGLWEKPKEEIEHRHFAFECDPEWVLNDSVSFLKSKNLNFWNFLNDDTERPMVFAWMPAIAIYFHDPDGHYLEFIGILEGKSRPELGAISYEEWLDIELKDLELQQLDLDGVNTLVGWAKEEGWNPGKHDYEAFYKADPEGFYGFFLKDKLIAGGAIVSYSGNYGFMGLFIVHPGFRGKGIGNKLWYLRRDKLIARLKEEAVIGMDGVVAMQPFYQKGGFEIAFIDERYECTGKSFALSESISNIEPSEFDTVLEYDSECFGYERGQFLSNWLKLPDSQFFKYTKGGKLEGYAVIRKVDPGFKIGPLFANDEAVAEELYKACLNSAIGNAVYLDIPTTNKGAVELVKKYDAKYVFECARMYYGGSPEVDINKIFGITTFELG